MKDLKTLAERLRYAMEVLPPKKIKGVDLARAVGVKPPSVSDWLSGKSKTMEGENLLKASKFLGVNPNWLATGSGKPFENMKEITHEKDELKSFNNIKSIDKFVRKIPVLDMVQAGNWREVVYDGINPIDEIYTTYIGTNPNDIFCVKVEGDSMTPRFHPQDQLIVDPNISVSSGDFVIACNNDYEMTFKKYRVTGYDEHGREEFELVPLNPDFAPFSSKIHKIKIIGVVVEHINRLK